MTSQNAHTATIFGGRLFQTLITVLIVLILLLVLPLSIAAETTEIRPPEAVALQDTGNIPTGQLAAQHHSCSFQNSCITLIFVKTGSLTPPVHNSSQFKNIPQTAANEGLTVSVILPPPLSPQRQRRLRLGS